MLQLLQKKGLQRATYGVTMSLLELLIAARNGRGSKDFKASLKKIKIKVYVTKVFLKHTLFPKTIPRNCVDLHTNKQLLNIHKTLMK